MSWEGSEEVLIEYQDVKITADRARYDFPTKTATLEGHVIIDQGPTRLSGDSAVFQLETKTGTLQNATADLPPSYHIVAESIDKIGEATYRVHHGSLHLLRRAQARLVLLHVRGDDHAGRLRAHEERLLPRARAAAALHAVHDLADQGGPRLRDARPGHRVHVAAGRVPRALALLGDGPVDGPDQAGRRLRRRDRRASGRSSAGRRSAESAGIFRGYFVHDTDATACLDPRSEARRVDSSARWDGNPGVLGTQTENRWKLQLDHVSDDLPWGMRGVVAIRRVLRQVLPAGLRARSSSTPRAREIASRAFLTKNEGVDSFNLRFEKSDTILAATVAAGAAAHPRVLPAHVADREGAPSTFRRRPRSRTSSSTGARTCCTGAADGSDLFPVLSFPWKGLPWLSATTTPRRALHGLHGLDRPAQTEFTRYARHSHRRSAYWGPRRAVALATGRLARHPRRGGRVVRQRPAKPRTPVRFRSPPRGVVTPVAMSAGA